LSSEVLRAHADGPQRLGGIQDRVSWVAEATIRGTLGTLRDLGALEKHRSGEARNAVATALTPAGEEMLAVSHALENWLARCPRGPIALGDGQARVAVKALAEGWSSTLIRALALSPCSLTELSSLISDVSYPSLERRISWMRASGQISPLPKESRGTPYEPTDWLRGAVAPLCVAGRCERRNMDDAPPITDVEIEAAFLLALPLVRLPRRVEGTCLLASRQDMYNGEDLSLAGTAVEVSGGEVVDCSVDVEGEPATWAIGTADAWLDAVIDGDIGSLRIGGTNPRLPYELVRGLNATLFTER
jgi:DNA-binding HxlR family transcriptional regulator